jgi:hypothetical protein
MGHKQHEFFDTDNSRNITIESKKITPPPTKIEQFSINVIVR